MSEPATAIDAAYAIGALWIAWLIVWQVSASNVKVAVRREPLTSRISHIAPLALGMALVAAGDKDSSDWFFREIWPRGVFVDVCSVLMTAAGLGFACWARVHIGRNWSATVTLKESHELIRTGPYAVVRHPIYTGFLFALLGAVLLRAEWRAIIGFAIATLAFLRKLRIEERWMHQAFGEQYERYKREVPMLVPFAG
jgi:protein-S-isoprenylcysteine O-methyltransferase Ste14